jgi:mRNA interferase RelE/StbE
VYSIRLTSSAEKQLDVLATSLFRRIDAKILTLASDPRPSGCKKLRGRIGTWRIRIGNYRVLYEVNDSKKQVTILGVLPRKEAYR